MNAVTVGNARFSYLGNGTLRLEYAPDARFDDRPTFRAISMPEPQPFDDVDMSDESAVCRADGIEIHYAGGGPLSEDNLRIEWRAGNMAGVWRPGDLDSQNLGGIGTMDHVSRTWIPEGVHTAGAPGIDRISEDNLASISREVQAYIDAHPDEFPCGIEDWAQIKDDLRLWPESLARYAAGWRKLPTGMVSRAGYTVLDETGMAFYDVDRGWIDANLRPEYQNIFLFRYGLDYALAMRQFTALCGRIPMPPRWAFGSWYSCFEKLTSEDNRQLVEKHDEHDIPLDVLIVDVDWHENDWNGWDWCTERYPDPAQFLAWVHDQEVHVALNLHCDSINRNDTHFKAVCEKLGVTEDVPTPPEVNVQVNEGDWGIDFADPRVWEAMRDVCFVPNEALGIDFWWLDNWDGKREGYNHVLWINHLVFRHMESDRGVRPLILGRHSGFGSHRYPAYFSGDTASHWEVLEYQLDVNRVAGQVGMNYFSHDLGGFKGCWPGRVVKHIDPELYVRWMQMGAMSPVMRVHSDHGIREPWKYDDGICEIVRRAYHLHTRLVPYFYMLARESYDTGMPIQRPMYFLYPDDQQAYEAAGQYFIGDRILAAPVASPGGRRQVYIPSGTFYELHTGRTIEGPTRIDRFFDLAEIPLYVRAGSIIPEQKPTRRIGTLPPDPLVLAVYPGGTDRIEVYEDDGHTPGYVAGECARWPVTLEDDGATITVTLSPIVGQYNGMSQKRTVRIEVCQIDRPAGIEIDGREPAASEYLVDERRVVVDCGRVDRRRLMRIVVRR